MKAGREADLYGPCLGLLKLRRVVAWRNNTTGVYDPKRGVFRTFAGRKGVSDLLGVLPGGRFLAVEVKRPGEVPTLDQKEFLADVAKAGGLALVVSDLKQLEAALEAEGY